MKTRAIKNAGAIQYSNGYKVSEKLAETTLALVRLNNSTIITLQVNRSY